jgi:hypothetical protein
MSSVEEIALAIKQLPPEMCHQLKSWLDAYAAELWDAQIERDVLAGQFDALGEEALEELRAGRCRDL